MLAGGQIIKRIVKKTLCLSGEKGLEIFDFKGTERKQLREQIKSAIDGLELSRTTKDAIVAENIRCFRMNINIVKAIRVNWSSYQKIGVIVAIVMSLLVITVLYLHVMVSS